MKILILPTVEAVTKHAARRLARQLKRKPHSVLGLATGGTMDRLYAALPAMVAEEGAQIEQMRSFNLDEYVGLSGDHPQSYRHYMATRFGVPLGVDLARMALPCGDAPDPAAEAARYETAIAEAGGIDLQLLGIGQNGHIGFNEPTSSLRSRTRIKTLTRSTVAANARYFDRPEDVPTRAITMGIATILDAREVLLLATGAAKAEALAAAIEGPLAAASPASALQLHPKATVLCDEDAAAALRLRDYYETVHPGGRDPSFGGPL